MRTCPRPSRRFPPASSRSLPWHPHRTSMAQHAPQRSAGPVADRGDTRHDLSICVCRGSSFSGAARFGSARPVRRGVGRKRQAETYTKLDLVLLGQTGYPRPLIDATLPTFKTSSGKGSRRVGSASAVNGLVRLSRNRNANSMASCWIRRASTGCGRRRRPAAGEGAGTANQCG